MPRSLIKGRWGSSKDEIDAARIDAATNSLICITYEHHEVHGGSHYNLHYSAADVGALTSPNDMMTLTWTTPNTTKWLHMVLAAITSSGARLRFIEDGTGGGASPTGIITARNRNRNYDDASTIINVEGTPAAGSVSYDATLVTGGTSLLDLYVGVDGLGKTFATGLIRGSQEWVLKQNTQYQVSLFEEDNVPGMLQLSWYEHTDRHG